MKSTGKNLIINFFVSVAKFLAKFSIVYYIFGVIALEVIVFCVGIVEYIQTGSSFLSYLNINEQEVLGFITRITLGLCNNLPFSHFFDTVCAESPVIGGELFSFLSNLTRGDLPLRWNEFAPTILPDITKLSIATFFLFIISRLNGILLKSFKDFPYRLAFFILTVLWTLAAFSGAAMVVEFVTALTEGEKQTAILTVIFILAMLLHILLLAFDGKFSTLRVAITLSIQIFFDLVCTVLIWYLCKNLRGLFVLEDFWVSVGVFTFVALLLKLIEQIKGAVTKYITLPLCSFFYNHGIRF